MTRAADAKPPRKAAQKHEKQSAALASAKGLAIAASAPPPLRALRMLDSFADLLPPDAGAEFREMIERFQAAKSFEEAISLPGDWRTRERNRLLRELRSHGLSSAAIKAQLQKGEKSKFRVLILPIIRLFRGHMPCERTIRRIVE
jgi:hypothetical protein